MKKSAMATIVIIIFYFIASGIIILGVGAAYGPKSIAMFITIIAIGPVFGLLLLTHKGLRDFLKRLDG